MDSLPHSPPFHVLLVHPSLTHGEQPVDIGTQRRREVFSSLMKSHRDPKRQAMGEK